MRRFNSVLIAFLTLALCACLGTFGGTPGFPHSSELQGFSTSCDGSLHILDPASGEAVTRLQTPPGSRNIQIVYESRPYSAQDMGPQYVCTEISHHSVRFDSRPGFTYRFFVSESSHSDHELTVWESAPASYPQRSQAPAEASQTSIRRACYLDGIFAGCQGLRP